MNKETYLTEVLRKKVDSWAKRMDVEPKQIRITHMKKKWGSCSSAGVISLASDLIYCNTKFQDYVIAHELLHLRIPNHSKLFKATLSIYIPYWNQFDINKPLRMH